MATTIIGSKLVCDLAVGDMFDSGGYGSSRNPSRGHRRVTSISRVGYTSIYSVATEHVDGGHPREFSFRATERVDLVGNVAI